MIVLTYYDVVDILVFVEFFNVLMFDAYFLLSLHIRGLFIGFMYKSLIREPTKILRVRNNFRGQIKLRKTFFI
jgi:hypothetical protein